VSPRRRIRLDQIMVDNGLVSNIEEARALVMAGEVSLPGASGKSSARGRPTAGMQVREDQEIALRARSRFVSRGGEKLARALERFEVDPAGMTVLDVGSSTGGFTDCVLQNGASLVYAVDAGRSQLHSRLVADDRVVSMEGVNAREPMLLPGKVDLILADVSFISLETVLQPVFKYLRPGGRAIVLFKPQFEARRGEVPKGGVIRDPALRAQLVGRFVAWLTNNGIRIRGLVKSPLLGDAGNAEFLFWLEPPA
jgi:23S rRNA (cytidine1920-2'-O)/16S rRNA (cytidine1409-2'-O)-methyltransferase